MIYLLGCIPLQLLWCALLKLLTSFIFIREFSFIVSLEHNFTNYIFLVISGKAEHALLWLLLI